MEFYCRKCELKFDATGEKKEYMDPTFGPCAKTVASCPECNNDATEYRKPKPAKKSSSSNFTPPPSCGAGGCCCG